MMATKTARQPRTLCFRLTRKLTRRAPRNPIERAAVLIGRVRHRMLHGAASDLYRALDCLQTSSGRADRLSDQEADEFVKYLGLIALACQAALGAMEEVRAEVSARGGAEAWLRRQLEGLGGEDRWPR
jgi:hypothetical protein